MKKFKLHLVLPCLLALGFFVNSCSRNEEATETVDAEVVSDNAFSDTSTELDFDFSMNVLSENNSLGGRLSNQTSLIPACATLTVVTAPNNAFPKTYTVDFGTSGCAGMNGVTRRGKLIINLSRPWYQSGAIMVITRDNYYVQDNKVEGTVTMTNQTVAGGAPTWTRKIENGKVTKPNGRFFEFYGIRSVSQVEGVGTPSVTDNIYKVFEGNHHVVKSNGNILDTTILEPLFKKAICQYIGKGKVRMTGTVRNGILDYGDGTCDNQAIFIDANGVSHTITL